MINRIMKSRLKKNALFNSFSFVFISGVNFLTLPYIVGKMNFEIFGIYTLLTSLFGYFGIFDFGLGQGLIKFASEYSATNQWKKLSLAINSCLIFQVTVGITLFLLLYGFSDKVVTLFNVSGENFSITVKAFKISLIGLFISLISAIFSSLLMGLQRYDLTSAVDSTINFLLNISLVTILMAYNLSLYQAVLLSVFFTFLTLVIYLILIHKNVSFYKPKFEFSPTIVKGFIKYSINIFLSKLSALFSTQLVRFILSYFLSPSAVTLFVVPSKLLGAVGGMLSNGANTIFPYISSLHAKKDMDVIKQSFLKATTLFAGISIPILLFFTFYSKQILTLWMGADFASKTWLILSISTFSSLIGSISTIPNLVILGMGNSRLIALFSVISITLYLIFLPLLTAKYGLVGCTTALLIASLGTITFVCRYSLKFIEISFWKYAKITYLHHLLPATVFIIASFSLKFFMPLSNIYLLELGCALLGAYYLIIYQKVYLQKNFSWAPIHGGNKIRQKFKLVKEPSLSQNQNEN